MKPIAAADSGLQSDVFFNGIVLVHLTTGERYSTDDLKFSDEHCLPEALPCAVFLICCF
jgi:hypothetical protein